MKRHLLTLTLALALFAAGWGAHAARAATAPPACVTAQIAPAVLAGQVAGLAGMPDATLSGGESCRSLP